MALNLMDLFKRITWANNGDITDMSQTDYEVGWAHLGDDTPTVEDFNLIQQLADRKDQWLFGQIYQVLKANKIEPTEENAQALLSALQKMLLSVSNKAKPKNLTAITTNTVDETGHTHEIDKASLTTAGLVRLTNDTGLDSEVLALTAKAGKHIAQSVAQLQQNVTNYLNQKVNKTDISDAVNSESRTHVASSKAVKIAYDKGVEAKSAADAAQRTANAKQSPATTLAGYGITDFVVKYLNDEDLNNIEVPGFYAQGMNIKALSSLHYPIEKAGVLEVRKSASGWMQIYTDYDNFETYIRRKYQNGISHWVRYDALSKFDKSGGILSGNLEINAGDWSKVRLKNAAGKILTLEVDRDNPTIFGSLHYLNGSNKEASLTLPVKHGTLLVDKDISYQKIGDFEIRRYPDGTMMQSVFLNLTKNDASILARVITWASAFKAGSTPHIYINATSKDDRQERDELNANFSVVANKNSGFKLICYDSDNHSENFTVSITAIGNWK